MLTRLYIKNFKRFESIDIELGKNVVFIGPNNSGKTTALQSLALWEIGMRRWNEKKKNKPSSEKRTGVSINRNDLISLPVPSAKMLWNNLHVRSTEKVNGEQRTQNIRIDILVEGITNDLQWRCGLEFDFANDESFHCRPLHSTETDQVVTMQIPPEAENVKIAFLPPMSGLAATEPLWQPGRISVLLGEGQTAQVLRNICYQIHESKTDWDKLVSTIRELFGVTLLPPEFIKERGEITMMFEEPSGIKLDLSSSGRGLQQTLLLLAYLYANPKTILLLDEPDAHLEVLRQRQVYQMITSTADRVGSQVIAASHSEVVLNEAAGKDIVVAFVGKPHRIDDRGSQVLKALRDIGFEQYYQAEQTGWVLYLEGSTDLAILQSFAQTLNHPASRLLDSRPFVYYIGNHPLKAREHFFALREAKKDIVGITIVDNIEKDFKATGTLVELKWSKRELENYLCQEEVLLAYARHEVVSDDLFSAAEIAHRETTMKKCIAKISDALRTLKKLEPWSDEIKASDDFLDPLFEMYFTELGLPNLLLKNKYYILADLVPQDKIDTEISEKLDIIVSVASQAKPTV